MGTAQREPHFFPNLIVLLLAYTTAFNVQVEEYLSFLLLLGSTGLVIGAYKKGAPDTPWLYLCPVAILSLSVVQYENSLWGFQMAWYLALFWRALSLFLLDRMASSPLPFAIVNLALLLGATRRSRVSRSGRQDSSSSVSAGGVVYTLVSGSWPLHSRPSSTFTTGSVDRYAETQLCIATSPHRHQVLLVHDGRHSRDARRLRRIDQLRHHGVWTCGDDPFFDQPGHRISLPSRRGRTCHRHGADSRGCCLRRSSLQGELLSASSTERLPVYDLHAPRSGRHLFDPSRSVVDTEVAPCPEVSSSRGHTLGSFLSRRGAFLARWCLLPVILIQIVFGLHDGLSGASDDHRFQVQAAHVLRISTASPIARCRTTSTYSILRNRSVVMPRSRTPTISAFSPGGLEGSEFHGSSSPTQ